MEWGAWCQNSAAKLLVRAALRDRANAVFALLSEAEVPMYPPAAVHAQLMAEERSRINACESEVPPAGLCCEAEIRRLVKVVWPWMPPTDSCSPDHYSHETYSDITTTDMHFFPHILIPTIQSCPCSSTYAYYWKLECCTAWRQQGAFAPGPGRGRGGALAQKRRVFCARPRARGALRC